MDTCIILVCFVFASSENLIFVTSIEVGTNLHNLKSLVEKVF